MIINPIIPIAIMFLICAVLIFFILFFELRKKKKSAVDIVLRLFAVVILFVINLRPMIFGGTEDVTLSDLDVLLVIDTTLSMSAQDMPNGLSRLDAAKADAQYIVSHLTGARFGIVTFDNTSTVLSPYTSDVTSVSDAIDSLEPLSYTYARSSNPDMAQKAMVAMLDTNKDNRVRVVFFFSDGEATDEKEINSFAPFKNYIGNGAVLGYGTTEGSKMYYQYFNAGEVYTVKDPKNSYQDALTVMDVEALKTIASDMNLTFYEMAKVNGFNKKVYEVDRIRTGTSQVSGKKKIYSDTYFIFTIVLFIILVIEFVRYLRSIYGKR